MNVCILYPNERSYSETFIHDQIRLLPERVFPLFGAYFPYLLPNHTHLLKRNLTARAYRKILKVSRGFSEQNFLNRALIRYLKQNRIDVALAQYGQTGTAVMECCAAANVPLVVHFHGADAFVYKILEEYTSGFRRLFQIAERVIVVSQDMALQIRSLGCLEEKIVLNHYGVDTGFFSGAQPETTPPRFIGIGRMVPKKAPHLTIRAFTKVLQEVPTAQLILIGDGALLEECKRLTADLKIESAVRFTGPLIREKVRDLLRESGVFVQHSIRSSEGDSEGMPVAALEAASTGLPAVVTRHAGLKEAVVHGETGFLVEEGDVDGMAFYMKRLAMDPELCSRMGKKARERMRERFEIGISIQRLDTILREAANYGRRDL